MGLKPLDRHCTIIPPKCVHISGVYNIGADDACRKALRSLAPTKLIGHNIKFDLLYLLVSGWIYEEGLNDIEIWDTQLAEYLLTAQTSTYPSLDECAKRYGGTLKDGAIKEFWASDVPTECIPDDLLEKYLEGDLNNTALVYKAQLEKVEKWDMQALMRSQMDALKATTIMEFYGMSIDRKYVSSMSEELRIKIEEEEKLLLSSIVLPSNHPPFNWGSGKDISNYLFGGNYIVSESHYVGKYKNGNDKYKKTDVTYLIAPTCPKPPEAYGSEKNKLGYWTVSDDVLKNVNNKVSKSILTLRSLSKQRETYYENLKSVLFPSSRIHANLNHVSTKTGRLSCNKPNIQNQTEEGGIKKSYISRWGEDGVIVDFDYSQLEMAGLAVISNDEQLSYDINHGVDMHIELYKEMYGRTPTKAERKAFKPLSFGLNNSPFIQ